jgi:hypothetical protein
MAENCTYVDGIGSTVAIDTAGEIVDLAGIDCYSLVGGALNWEHKADIPAQIVGKILEYKKIFSEKDCENDRHKYFWDKCKTPYLYVMGRLFDDKKESSKECAALFLDDAEHPDEPPMVGFSIEGSKVDKKGLVVTKSIARKVTITNMNANKQCAAEMIPAEPAKPDSDSIFKSEPSFCIELLEKSDQPEKHQKKIQSNVRKPTKHWTKQQGEVSKFFKQNPKTEARETDFAQGGSGASSPAHKQSSNPENPTFTHDRRIKAIPHRSMRKNEQMKKGLNLPPNWKPSKTKHAKLGDVVSFTHPEHGTVTIHKDPSSGMHEVRHAGKTAGIKGKKGSFKGPKEAFGHAVDFAHGLHSGKILSRETTGMSSDPSQQMGKAEEQKYHIHVKGQRITRNPLSIDEIKQQHGKTPQEMERNPDVKVIPHHPQMNKALCAGSGMAGPGNLVQGAALGKESMDKKMKKNEKLEKAKVDEGKSPDQKAWDRSGRNDRTGTTTTTWTKQPGAVGKALGMKPKHKTQTYTRSHAAAGNIDMRVGTAATPGHAPKTSATHEGSVTSSRKVVGTPRKSMKKSQTLQRAEQDYANWAKREEFEAFMAKSMPHLAKGQIVAIGQVLCLSKSMKDEKKLAKMMTSSPSNSFVEKKEKK